MAQRTHPVQRLTTAVLCLAIAGLGALTWIDHTTPVDIAPVAPARAAANHDGAAGVPDLPSALALADPNSAYPETRARPLFRPDRRPYVAAAAPPPAPQESAPELPASAVPEVPVAVEEPPPAPPPWPEGLRLVGIVSDGSSARQALIRLPATSPGTSEVRALEEGATLEGWRLARIDSASATFETAGTLKILELFAREAATTAPAASAAP